MAKQRYDYYAFISYNHRDSKWAKWIQKELEHYHLPVALVRENPDLPKRITPVFRDSSDLVARGPLLSSLKEQLDSSNYLIVLCSTNSAHAPWVNDEIEYFIQTGRKDQIIPVIIDGKPHAEDPERECYPPALAGLSSQEELLGISVEDYGRRGVLLRVVATLLNLKLDQLVARDRAERIRKRILLATLLSAVALTVFGVMWYNIPHVSYYQNYTYSWESPVGIGKVSNSRRKEMDYTYRFTTQRGYVTEVERVNSAGILVAERPDFSWSDPPSMKFFYGTNDKFGGRSVTRAAYYDIYGRELYEKNYSADLKAVDFVQSQASSTSFTIGADQSGSQADIRPPSEIFIDRQERGDIIRYIQDYDENGYLIRRMFKRDNRGSSGGTPVQDKNGVWGICYFRDNLGRIVELRYVDQEGAVMNSNSGNVGYDYIYGEQGRIVSESRVDERGKITPGAFGIGKTVIEYDSQGRPASLASYGIEDRPAQDGAGVFLYDFDYDDRGFLISVCRYNHEMELCYDTAGICITRFEHDEQGREISCSYHDPEGNLFPCLKGYAKAECGVDFDGQMLWIRYLGAEGLPAVDRSIHAHKITWLYEEKQMVRADYFDIQEQPTPCKYGYASFCCEYNEERELCCIQYLGTDGKPVQNYQGCAELRYDYTDGLLTKAVCLDETGASCLESRGMAGFAYTYESGQLASAAYFGTEGEAVVGNEGYHEVRYTYDDNGLLLKAACYGTKGERVINEQNFSAIAFTYDSWGRKITETYYDEEDREWPRSGGEYQVQYEYDDRGNLIREHLVKETGIQPGQIQDIFYTYDDNGNQTSCCWMDAWGNPAPNPAGNTLVEKKYDAFNRVVGECFYRDNQEQPYYSVAYEVDERGMSTRKTDRDEDGKVSLITDSQYDGLGNCIQIAYLDEQGQPVIGSDGCAVIRNQYDIYGNQTDSRCYDEKDFPMCSQLTGAFHIARTYAADGKLLTTESYDVREQPVISILDCFRCEKFYDTWGRLAEEWKYDEKGKLLGGQAYVYGKREETIQLWEYDKNKNVKSIRTGAFRITQVLPNYPAEAAGLKENDILMVYNSWFLDLALTDVSHSYRLFQQELRRGIHEEKRVTVARLSEDGTRASFLSLILPEGEAGYAIGQMFLYQEQIEWLLGEYAKQ